MGKAYIDFPHRPGGHCGSTVLRDLLKFYGHDLTEDMVFGLGAGLGFIFFKHDEMNPPIYIGGRIFNLEGLFCEHIGVNMEEIRGLDDEEAWQRVKDQMDGGAPAVVQADVYYLDYLRAKRHFAAHRIVLVGYDEDAGVAYVGDNDREDIQECSLENLRKARSSSYMPQPAENAFYRFQVPARLVPLVECVPIALEKAVAYNLRLTEENGRGGWKGARFFRGVWGMENLVEDMSSWESKMNEETLGSLFKSIYVTVEKGGTGYGGFFRRIYGRFLKEAASELTYPPLNELGDFYISLGDDWTDIADLCRRRSGEPREALQDVIDKIAKALEKEREALVILESQKDKLKARSNGSV